MATITTDDGQELYYEECGAGTPIVFVHEFAGDLYSWEPQLRYFSRRYRCVAYNARGWPPSSTPHKAGSYSQLRACDDILAVLDGLGIERAHVVGLSMGGYATMHFGFNHSSRALSLLISGVGYGAEPAEREKFRGEADFIARDLRENGMAPFAARYAVGPTRVQYQSKDPRGWKEFAERLAEHSSVGAALTQQGVQKERPSIFDLEAELKSLRVPTLIVTGDEDWPCLIPNVFMKRSCPTAQLLVIPGTGHAVNIEEPAFFNAALEQFLVQVDAGRWPERDPRAVSDSITGMR